MRQAPSTRAVGGALGTIALLAVCLAGLPGAPPAVAAAPSPPPRSSGGLAAFIALPEPVDAIAPEQLQQIRAALTAREKRLRAGAERPVQAPTGADTPFLYPFFPQAGVLGRDLFLNNFTDQSSSAGLFRDWDCSDYSYDGHHGHYSRIRSFREQAIGVPVFAVLPGVVLATHDGEPDENTVQSAENLANFVSIDHGGGYTGLYFHLRRGSVAVAPGQTVAAGTQLGLTGSSGFSNWPDLHF